MRAFATLIFCISIVLGSLLPLEVVFGYREVSLLLILALVFCGLLVFSKKTQTSGYLFFFCVCLGVSLGAARGLQVESKNASKLENFYNKTVVLRGKVSDYPDKREGHTNLTLGSISIGTSTQIITERILVQAPLYPEYKYGDTLEVSGKIIEPQSALKNDDGSVSRFSYKKFLSKDNIYSIIYRPQIKLVKKHESSLIGTLYTFKDKCLAITKVYISEPGAGLLSGILFGAKRALGSEVLDIFTKAGLVHIVVLSGYNVALIISAGLKSTKFVSKKASYIIVGLALVLFVLFVGAGSAVVRAVLMAAIALLARVYGKQGYSVTVLFFAAAIMSLFDPRDTLYDPGFALSFLATAGLILWTPIIYKKISLVTDRFLLREITATSAAAWFVTLPYILWYMGKVSVVSLLANIIVLPLVPIVMILGAILVLVGLIYVPATLPIALPLSLLLSILISLATFFAGLPMSNFVISISTLVCVLMYVLQIYFVALLSKDSEKSSGYFL